MKDSELVSSRASSEETERFQTSFLEQQNDLKSKLSSADQIPKNLMEKHLADVASGLLSLQRLYSSSAPYLKIYDRKICQDRLQSLQTNLQEVEARLLPKKKFMFKGSRTRGKGKTDCVSNGEKKSEVNETKDSKPDDTHDGPDSTVYRDLTDEVLIIPATAITGRAILLSNLQNCTVQLLGAPSTLHIAKVSGCSIACGPVNTSVFVEAATTCQMQLACQQLRIHQTAHTEFRIHVTCKAIIEDCSNLLFGVYSFSYPTLNDDYVTAGLRKDVNNWKDVDDFNWLAVGQASPNWSLISEVES